MSNYLHTFKSLLTQGIIIDDNNTLRIAKVLIPRLQRAYAQGRKSESELRELFLTDIFNALQENCALEMNFVYGSAPVASLDEERNFELLDGQQRLTTLFLLHWYVANQELDSIPDYLQKFEYQTRTTSTDFIKELTARKINLSDKPSKTIRKAKWYSYAFQNDATITAMLTMLDSIDEKYKQLFISNVYDRLDNLKFYVLLLEGYGLSEELYIKMNARGLALTPFENFKSDFIKYMKNDARYQNIVTAGKLNAHTLQYYLAFASNVDTKWIDLFWKKDSTSAKEYNRRYFRFFYRYFFIKYVLDVQKDTPAEDFRRDEIVAFFDDVSERMQEERYLHFAHYAEVLNANPDKDYFRAISGVLDILYTYYDDVIRPAIQYPFEGGSNWDFYSEKNTYTRVYAIIFTAVVEYLEACAKTAKANIEESFIPDNFRRWMRVVWNITENSNIDGIVPQVGLMRRFHELINLENATTDIYMALSKREKLGNDGRALLEEIDKASEIINHPDQDWEGTFSIAENHPFLRGMVGLFFTPNITTQQFIHRYENVKKLFETEAIAEPFRQDAILIRAIMAQLNSWFGGLANLTFTQVIERKENVLKNILASKDGLKEMFCRVLDLPEENLLSALEEEAKPKDIVDDRLSESDRMMLQQAYNRLCTDKHIYKWMWDVEGWRKKQFRIQWLYGHIFAAVPYTSASRIVLDTEREKIAEKLIRENGFINIDEEQQKRFESDHLYYGYNIEMYKTYEWYNINIRFEMGHYYKILLYVEDAQKREDISEFFTKKGFSLTYSGELLELYEGQYNLLDETYKLIVGDLNDLSNCMKEYVNL